MLALLAVVVVVGLAAVAAGAWARAAQERAAQEGRSERTSGVLGAALSALDKLLSAKGEKE
jgi:type II secretory pathway pseudopilin PulG